MYSKKQILSEIKAHCKELGFTFKVNDKKLINNNNCYMLTQRYTDNVIIDRYGNRLNNFSLQGGYETMQNGGFITISKDNNHFLTLNK